MKIGLITIVALVGSAFLANVLLEDPGYVVINFRGYLVETSVFLLAALVVSFIILVWLLLKLIRAPRKLGEAAARYRSGRAGQRLTRGMIEIAEGNFAKGERMLARTAHKSDAPLLNYLQAARAAHLLGDDERRDAWLRQAYEQTPEAANAVLLTQAELQLDQGQYEPALATLRKLEENSPNHGRALLLLGRVYRHLHDWDNLATLLPRLRKLKNMDPTTIAEWTVRVHSERLHQAADGNTVELVWQDIPKSDRKIEGVKDEYFASLIRTGLHDKAEKELAAELKGNWRGPLVRLYGLADASNVTKQLKRAEVWLTTYPEDTDLLLAAARLCLKSELWGKARSYLETVISLKPTPEAYQEYGTLLNRLGESDAAANAFQQGLSIVSAVAPPNEVPRLTADPQTASELPRLGNDTATP